MDIEHMKKNFLSTDQGSAAAMNKPQSKTFWKELTQFASKVRQKDLCRIKTELEWVWAYRWLGAKLV